MHDYLACLINAHNNNTTHALEEMLPCCTADDCNRPTDLAHIQIREIVDLPIRQSLITIHYLVSTPCSTRYCIIYRDLYPVSVAYQHGLDSPGIQEHPARRFEAMVEEHAVSNRSSNPLHRGSMFCLTPD